MTKLFIQFLLVTAVFAIVLGGSYPIMLEARRQEKFNHYPDKLTLEEGNAQYHYKNVQDHPEKIEAFLAAGDELASVLIRQQKFDPAIAIYQKQLETTWGLAPNSYNQRWTDANLKLAGVFRDRNDNKTALLCYQTVLDHDRKYLPASDPKIARDLNNIGLMHYLTGLTLDKDSERQPEFQLAIDNYKQALNLTNTRLDIKDKNPATAITLWNLYLAQRDIGHKTEAEDYRKQAQALDESMHRVCREP